MPNCKVKGCPIGNGWYRGPKHTLFRFPKNESILKEWKDRIGMPNLQVSEHTRVCSKHFEDEAFVTSLKFFTIFRFAQLTNYLQISQISFLKREELSVE